MNIDKIAALIKTKRKEKGITLLEIPNSFAKSYETIKELILISCGQQIEQLELF